VPSGGIAGSVTNRGHVDTRAEHRSIHVAFVEKVRGYHANQAYRMAMRKRTAQVEPLFADAKEWHGLQRLRLRSLMNANIQGLLIAAGQSLKRLLAAAGWGRRHAPCGSVLTLSQGLRVLIAAY